MYKNYCHNGISSFSDVILSNEVLSKYCCKERFLIVYLLLFDIILEEVKEFYLYGKLAFT